MENNIILVNPAIQDEKVIVDYPLGLAYLASALRSNRLEVDVVDLFYKDNEITLLNKIFLSKPIIVGITCTTPNFTDILTLASKIKRISPNTCLVLGGHHVTSIAENILKKYMQIDCVILYEGEESICQLAFVLISKNINDIKKIDGIAYRFKDNSIYINKTHNRLSLEKYPLPAWDLIISPNDMIQYFHKKQASIITMRGCWGNCSFCDTRCISKINYKNLRYVENEIDFLKNYYDVEFIYIQDLDILKNKKRALGISKLMQAKGIKGFQIVTRADSLVNSYDIIDEICYNGCSHIEVGIESGSDSQLKRYNKKVTSDINSQAIKILKNLKKTHNVHYSISFIMFDPFVTIKELTENYNFFIKNSIDNNENEKWLFSILDIFPGTEIQNTAYKRSLTYERGSDANSLFYRFENDEVAFFYSYIYSFFEFVYPMVIKIRKIISENINNEKAIDVPLKTKLYGLYVSINSICFKYFKELLSSSFDEYDKVFKNYNDKVFEILHDLNA